MNFRQREKMNSLPPPLPQGNRFPCGKTSQKLPFRNFTPPSYHKEIDFQWEAHHPHTRTTLRLKWEVCRRMVGTDFISPPPITRRKSIFNGKLTTHTTRNTLRLKWAVCRREIKQDFAKFRWKIHTTPPLPHGNRFPMESSPPTLHETHCD